jgi:putative iron-dependent peroxidase
MGGVNLVTGFRPELWRAVVPDDAPEIEGFNRDLVGPDGYLMPATQHDAVLWLSGSAYDVVFDVSRGAIGQLATLAFVLWVIGWFIGGVSWTSRRRWYYW